MRISKNKPTASSRPLASPPPRPCASSWPNRLSSGGSPSRRTSAKARGGSSAFGKLRHYANPHLTGDERAAWLKKQGENTGDARFRTTTVADPATTIVDETVLLHYLLDDEPRPSAKARRLIASGCAQAYPETAALTVQLLEEDYRVPRSLIGTVMELLADDVSFQDGATVRLAARLYAGNRLSFTACLIAARNVLTGYPVETFNKQLSNITR